MTTLGEWLALLGSAWAQLWGTLAFEIPMMEPLTFRQVLIFMWVMDLAIGIFFPEPTTSMARGLMAAGQKVKGGGYVGKHRAKP